VIWASRLYRSALFTLFISGIAVSAANPQLALFFVNDLHAPLPVAGLYYLTNIVSPLIGFAIGRYSDRISDRLRLFRVGASIGAIGWVLMAVSTQIWMPFVISVLALGIAGAAGSQVYAAVRDELSRDPTESDTKVISTIRMSFTAGWIVGPVLGSWLAGVFGIRVLLVVVAVLTVAQMIPMVGTRAPRYVAPGDIGVPQERLGRRSFREMLPLFAFALLCMLALSGDTLKFAFLPVYMQNVLHTAPAVRGAVIATQPVFELLLIPVASAFALRIGAMRVVLIGSAFGVAAHLCYALSTNVAELFLGQFLMSVLWAGIAGLGVTIAQHLYPKGPGLATSTYMSTTVFASTLGGLTGSVAIVPLGLPGVYFIPAIICALSFVGLFFLSTTLRRREKAAGVPHF
jgi:SET family sugar efflux transporter-like MFS transporter